MTSQQRIEAARKALRSNKQPSQSSQPQSTTFAAPFSNPYANEQAQLESQISYPKQEQPQQSSNGGFWGKVSGGIGDAFTDIGHTIKGGAKGALHTIDNASQLGQKALGGLTGIDAPISSLPRNLTTPNEKEKYGFTGEQIAEYFVPGPAANKLSKAIDIAADGAKLGKLGQAAIKILGKGAVQGTAGGVIGSAQSGSIKEGAKVGATVGGISAGTNVVGEVLRASRIPEWFYSKIFRTSSDDMLQELKTVGTQNLQKTNPQLYQQLVNSGVIKLDKTGKVILNETLAKEALDRGLKGSLKNMSNEVVKNTYELEDAAQRLTNSHQVPIKIEPQYQKVLQGVIDDYKDVGFGEISQKAEGLLNRIQTGQADATTALELRRFLDGMRTRFNPNATLSQSQQNFKTLADTLRSRLAREVPGLKPIMNEYRFNIEALEALAKEAAKRGNREVIGLLDTVFFGSGIATGNPAAGAVLGVGRRLINSPAGTTKIGQALNQLGFGNSKAGILIKGAAGYLTANRDNR